MAKTQHDSPENIALLRFRDFYKESLFSSNKQLLPDAFLYPEMKDLLIKLQTKGITKETQQDVFFSTIRTGEVSSVMNFYWSLHTDMYIQRLHVLNEQLPKSICTNKTKAIICIAAMNEVNIGTAIHAAKKAYEGNFEKEITVIVYHNYKTAPNSSLRKAILQLKKIPNVFVINEKVPTHNTVAMAKKVLTDSTQLHLGDALDIPLILMDADVLGCTKGTINAAINSLADVYTLAASPEYDFDPKIKKKFPVLGIIWEIDKHMAKLLKEHGFLIKFTLGVFTIISRKVLAMSGGIKVVTSNSSLTISSIVSEDPQLSKDLLHMVAYDEYGFLQLWTHNPIFPLEKYGYFVYMDASREIQDLTQGNAYDLRWRNVDHNEQVSGTKRITNATIPKYTDIPELGTLISNNLAKALNNYRKNTYDSSFYYDDGNMISKLLLSVLDRLGFTTTFSAIKVEDIEEAMPLEDTQLSKELVLDTNDWKIAEFKRVERKV
jgi:hypothetical protein